MGDWKWYERIIYKLKKFIAEMSCRHQEWEILRTGEHHAKIFCRRCGKGLTAWDDWYWKRRADALRRIKRWNDEKQV